MKSSTSQTNQTKNSKLIVEAETAVHYLGRGMVNWDGKTDAYVIGYLIGRLLVRIARLEAKAARLQVPPTICSEYNCTEDGTHTYAVVKPRRKLCCEHYRRRLRVDALERFVDKKTTTQPSN